MIAVRSSNSTIWFSFSLPRERSGWNQNIVFQPPGFRNSTWCSTLSPSPECRFYPVTPVGVFNKLDAKILLLKKKIYIGLIVSVNPLKYASFLPTNEMDENQYDVMWKRSFVTTKNGQDRRFTIRYFSALMLVTHCLFQLQCKVLNLSWYPKLFQFLGSTESQSTSPATNSENSLMWAKRTGN